MTELRFVRIFDAPRELVFDCMLDPDHLTHFWGPDGTSTPRETIVVEPREGGRFSAVIVSDADDTSYEFSAVYLEIVRPERLVWRDERLQVVTTSTFEAVNDKRTRVEIVQSDAPDFMADPAAQAGFATSLDRLQEYLGKDRT
jgi:uncharacterized protein YndB with AHSA1/START domain